MWYKCCIIPSKSHVTCTIRCAYPISHSKIDLGGVISVYIQLEYSNILMLRLPSGVWESSSVMISKNISHSGLRPSCDIFLDIITLDDFQTPRDIWASKCSRILVAYTFISTSTSSRLIWKKYRTRTFGPRAIFLISHSSINLTVWYNIIPYQRS